MFLKIKLTINYHGSDFGLSLNRRQAIIWTNEGIVYWRIYASLALTEYSCQSTLLNMVEHYKKLSEKREYVACLSTDRFVKHLAICPIV